MKKRNFEIKEKGLPDLSGMMLSTLDALRLMGGSGTIQEIDETVIETEKLSEVEQSYSMPNNEPRLKINYYLAWARTYLKRGGALENSSRGIWSLTEKGRDITKYETTRTVYDKVNAEERERARLKKEDAKSALKNIPDDSSDDAQEYSVRDPYPESDWKSELLDVLRSIKPDAFERLSQRLLREAGFIKVEVRGKSGDGGIDGVGVLRVNLISFQVYFQCKRYKGSVGSKEIRDFRGALEGRADKGLFITTGHFTRDASEEATRDGAKAIDLIDGDRLCELLKENQLGVATKMVEEVEVNAEWFKGI